MAPATKRRAAALAILIGGWAFGLWALAFAGLMWSWSVTFSTFDREPMPFPWGPVIIALGGMVVAIQASRWGRDLWEKAESDGPGPRA